MNSSGCGLTLRGAAGRQPPGPTSAAARRPRLGRDRASAWARRRTGARGAGGDGGGAGTGGRAAAAGERGCLQTTFLAGLRFHSSGGVSQAHWLHYVTALETSVSVNLWAASAEESTLNQLMAPPQPCAQADDEFRLRWSGLTRRCRRRAGRAAACLGAALRPALPARRAPIRRPQPPPEEEAARQKASRRRTLRSLRSGGWLPRGDAGAQGLRRGAGRGCCLRGWLCASAYLCQPRSRAPSCPKETVFT